MNLKEKITANFYSLRIHFYKSNICIKTCFVKQTDLIGDHIFAIIFDHINLITIPS